MSENIAVRSYTPGDEEEIVELLITVFNGWPQFDLGSEQSSLTYWDWKYQKNPFKKNLIVIAECDDKIVGCFHAIPLKINIGDHVYQACTGTDLAVHPNYRRLGIYNKMYNYQNKILRKESIVFRYGVTNNPILIERGKRLGFMRLPYKQHVFTKIKDLKLHQKHTRKIPLIKKYGYYVLNIVNKINMKLISRDYDINRFNIIKTKQFDDSIEMFWNRIMPYYNFIIKRDKPYLNWRYCDPLNSQYKVLKAEENGHLCGYCVFCINRIDKNYPVGFILDLLTLPENIDVAYALIEEVARYFEDNEVNVINWQILGNHPHGRVALNFDFLNSRYQNIMTYQPDLFNVPRDEKKMQNSLPSKIHFVYGDFDWI